MWINKLSVPHVERVLCFFAHRRVVGNDEQRGTPCALSEGASDGSTLFLPTAQFNWMMYGSVGEASRSNATCPVPLLYMLVGNHVPRPVLIQLNHGHPESTKPRARLH